MIVQVCPTQNEWDAPFHMYHYPDGRTQLRRDNEMPPDLTWDGHTYLPHAVIYTDGVLSGFDLARQP